MIRWSTIGELFTIVHGRKFEVWELMSSGNADLLYIDTLSRSSNPLSLEHVKRISRWTYTLPENILPPNSVVLAMSRPNAGNCAVVNTEAAIGVNCVGLLPSETQNTQLLYYYLHYIKDKIITSFGNVSTEKLLAQKYPVFPVETQERLLSILKTAEAIVVKRNDSLNLLDELLDAIFLEIYRHADIYPEHFTTTTLSDMVESTSYGFNSKRKGAYRYIQPIHINAKGDIDLRNAATTSATKKELEDHGLKKGDIVFCPVGSDTRIGNTAVYRDAQDTIISGNMVSIRLNKKANPYFLSSYLNSQQGQNSMKVGSKLSRTKHISMLAFLSIRIPLPSHQSQDEYAARAEIVFALRDKAIEQLQTANDLFNSLLQQAFSGNFGLSDSKSDDEPVVETGTGEESSPVLTKDAKSIPESKSPGKKRREKTGTLTAKKQALALYKWLREELNGHTYKKNKQVKKLAPIIDKFIGDLEKQKHTSRLPVFTLLEKYGLPDYNDLEAIKESFEEYSRISYDEVDIWGFYQRFSSYAGEARNLIATNPFFSYRKETREIGILHLKQVDGDVKTYSEAVAEENEQELRNNPPVELGENISDEVKIGNEKVALAQFVSDQSLTSFDIADLIRSLEYEGYRYSEITEENVRKGVNEFIDNVIVSELSNQPFTFDQLRGLLETFNFIPAFGILNDYIFNRMETAVPFLRQVYFDEQMAAANQIAYQYLLDTMNQQLMGGDVVTPPRRMFLLYSSPQIQLDDAIEKA